MSALYIVVKGLVPDGHQIFTVLHVTLVFMYVQYIYKAWHSRSVLERALRSKRSLFQHFCSNVHIHMSENTQTRPLGDHGVLQSP
jgi:hypothetical protein